ncbi:MAG TPA: YbjN domain-containing protein [Blastocatellia bacterium]|nr:YbjN domain-containing protein [Blastocatellia bacterium]
MKKNLTTATLLLAALALCFPGPAAVAQAQNNKPSARVAVLLEETGYPYSKAADNVWAIDFQGKSMPKFNVIASTHEDVLVLFTIVAEKDSLRLTPGVIQKLLQLNGDLDRVKIGIDKDGDLFVRTDLSIRVLDVREMKENIEQVAAATDVVYATVKSSIGGPK